MYRLIPAVAAALTLVACAVGPNYRAPATAPVTVANAQGAAFDARVPPGAWWKEFADPELDALITRALASNLDLRIALDRVRASRAVFVESALDLAPHVTGDGAYARSREQVPGFGTSRVDIQSASLGFDAAWELDLFGRVRRTVEAARAEAGAADAGYRDAEVTVAAEVARNYFELRGAQKELAVARGNLGRERESLELTQLREDAGRGAELDVKRSLARLKATEATIPPLEAAERQAGYRLAVLIGQRPGTLDEELKDAPTAPYAKALPIGDATALLKQRPDVRAAERELAAATARVGIATADFFPRVSITGFIGFLSGDVNRLFGTTPGLDTRAWSVTPSVSWAALDLGSVHARLRARKAEADAAAARYEQVVLTALEDTENSFLGYAKRQEALKSLADQADASRRAAEIAGIQYREGVADYLTLLDAERTELEAESSVARAETAVNVAVVAIYKALGGINATIDSDSNHHRPRSTAGGQP